MAERWIPLPAVPPLLSTSAPLMVPTAASDAVRAHVSSAGARLGDLSLDHVTTTVEFFEPLRQILSFPEWCGSGWDSVDDAFEEIRAASSFPCFVLVNSIQELFSREPHLALAIVVRLSELQGAFATSGDQFVVIYQVE